MPSVVGGTKNISITDLSKTTKHVGGSIRSKVPMRRRLRFWNHKTQEKDDDENLVLEILGVQADAGSGLVTEDRSEDPGSHPISHPDTTTVNHDSFDEKKEGDAGSTPRNDDRDRPLHANNDDDADVVGDEYYDYDYDQSSSEADAVVGCEGSDGTVSSASLYASSEDEDWDDHDDVNSSIHSAGRAMDAAGKAGRARASLRATPNETKLTTPSSMSRSSPEQNLSQNSTTSSERSKSIPGATVEEDQEERTAFDRLSRSFDTIKNQQARSRRVSQGLTSHNNCVTKLQINTGIVSHSKEDGEQDKPRSEHNRGEATRATSGMTKEKVLPALAFDGEEKRDEDEVQARLDDDEFTFADFSVASSLRMDDPVTKAALEEKRVCKGQPPQKAPKQQRQQKSTQLRQSAQKKNQKHDRRGVGRFSLRRPLGIRLGKSKTPVTEKDGGNDQLFPPKFIEFEPFNMSCTPRKTRMPDAVPEAFNLYFEI